MPARFLRGLGFVSGLRILLVTSTVVRARHRLQEQPENPQRLFRLRCRFRQVLLDGTQLEQCHRARNHGLPLLEDEAMCRP